MTCTSPSPAGRPSRLRLRSLFLTLLLPAVMAGAASAQMGGGPGPAGPTPFLLGLRGGWEINNSDWVLGAHARTGVPGLSFLDLQVVGDLTFVNPPGFVEGPSFQERSLSTDLLYRLGTLAVGGGAVFRNTFWVDLDTPRETRTGWSGLVVLGGIPGPRSRFAFQLEYRYIRVGGLGLSTLTAGGSVVPTRLF